MSKEFVAARKLSAIVALALAVVVSFAAINSYGDSKSEEFIVYDVEASIERAYTDLIEEEALVLDLEVEPQLEIIKIFDNANELIETVTLVEGESIENKATQRLLNRSEYLSSFGNTSVYKITE